MRLIAILVVLGMLTACQAPQRKVTLSPVSTKPTHTLEDFQKRAAHFNSIISLPQFETTPYAVAQTVTNAIREGNAGLDRVGQLAPKSVTFQNTIRALDDVSYRVNLTANRLELLKETSTNAAVRDAATA